MLSSAVPFLADLLALRRVPAHFFGIFMSVNPVFAALIGMLVLHQHLDLISWLAITTIVTANTVTVGTAARTGGASWHAAPVRGGSRGYRRRHGR